MTELEALRAQLATTEARLANLERQVRALINNDTAARLGALQLGR